MKMSTTTLQEGDPIAGGHLVEDAMQQLFAALPGVDHTTRILVLYQCLANFLGNASAEQARVAARALAARLVADVEEISAAVAASRAAADEADRDLDRIRRAGL